MAERVAHARPSSTVVLARDSANGPEYLLVRRRARSAFGSKFAFPGGVLEASDTAARGRCSGVDAAVADRLLAVERGGLDYFSAAARELFEETGVLLAASAVDAGTLERCRQRLNACELDWEHFLAGHELDIRCDELCYFSHWITPDSLPRRYSTRFFAAKLPAGQVACHDEIELTDSRWMTANAALDAASAGNIGLPFPTHRTLEALLPHASVDALIDWARGRASAGVEAIRPVLPNDDPRAHPVIPSRAESC